MGLGDGLGDSVGEGDGLGDGLGRGLGLGRGERDGLGDGAGDALTSVEPPTYPESGLGVAAELSSAIPVGDGCVFGFFDAGSDGEAVGNGDSDGADDGDATGTFDARSTCALLGEPAAQSWSQMANSRSVMPASFPTVRS